MDALHKTGEAAMKHYEGNIHAWQAVIDAIYRLFPQKDMDAFSELCEGEEYGLIETDKDGITDLAIIFDVDDEDDGGGGYTPRTARVRHVAHEGYLAKHMWAEYANWLGHRPEELEKFKQFEVSVVRICLYLALLSSFITNLILCQALLCPSRPC